MTTHFMNDSSTDEWLAAAREWETEGDRTPIQTDPPHDVVMDEATPFLLRKQAA